jgi:ribonuclease Z
MAEITFLGTANALPNKDHDSSHLLVNAGKRLILVDCAGNPVIRLDETGIDLRKITDVILTHFHPDHVSGLPLLLLDLLLMGRKEPLNIYGLHEVVDRVMKMMELFEWQTWEDAYPVVFHRLPTSERTTLIDTDTVKVWSSPMCHAIPSIGLRMAFPGGTVCYSSTPRPVRPLSGWQKVQIF